MLSCICILTWKYLYITVMALVGFSASAVQALTYQNGDYMGSLNKKASGAQCFIMALGLFWDIVTGLPWTPNGVGSLGPRGYCILLPGAHYLTINSPYGADSSLNKLLYYYYSSIVVSYFQIDLNINFKFFQWFQLINNKDLWFGIHIQHFPNGIKWRKWKEEISWRESWM